MVIGKYTDVFRGILWFGGVTWVDLTGEENFNEGGAGFSSIILKKGKN